MLNDFDPKRSAPVELLPFEANRLVHPGGPAAASASGTVVVLELFDKAAPGFTDDDRRLVAAAAEVGAELLRQALAERQTHRAAVRRGGGRAQGDRRSLTRALAHRVGQPPPAAVMERLKEGLGGDANATADADTTLRLVEAVRALAVRHGPAAPWNTASGCVNDLRKLLDEHHGRRAWPSSMHAR